MAALYTVLRALLFIRQLPSPLPKTRLSACSTDVPYLHLTFATQKDLQFPLLGVLVKDYVGHRLLEPAAPALVVDEVQIRMEMHGAASRVGDIPWLVQQRASPGGSQ